MKPVTLNGRRSSPALNDSSTNAKKTKTGN